ncbi:MAG: hypothetical protein QM783_13035 [Phycisphaerales bacterium]
MSGATSILSMPAAAQAGAKTPLLKDVLAKLGPSPAAKAARASQESFLDVMSQHVTGGAASKPFTSLNETQKAERARNAAEELVSVAFVQPILKNLRGGGVMGELPAPFGPGAGEKQFRTIADAQMARHLVHASNWGLVDSLTKKLLKPTGGDGKKLTKAQLAGADALPGSPAAIKRAKLAKTHASDTPAANSTLDIVH